MENTPKFQSVLIVPKNYYCVTKGEKVDEQIEYEPGKFKDSYKYVDRLDLERMKEFPKYVIEEFEKRLKENDLQYNKSYYEEVDVVLNKFLFENHGKINVWKVLLTQSTGPDGDVTRSVLVLYEVLDAVK